MISMIKGESRPIARLAFVTTAAALLTACGNSTPTAPSIPPVGGGEFPSSAVADSSGLATFVNELTGETYVVAVQTSSGSPLGGVEVGLWPGESFAIFTAKAPAPTYADSMVFLPAGRGKLTSKNSSHTPANDLFAANGEPLRDVAAVVSQWVDRTMPLRGSSVIDLAVQVPRRSDSLRGVSVIGVSAPLQSSSESNLLTMFLQGEVVVPTIVPISSEDGDAVSDFVAEAKSNCEQLPRVTHAQMLESNERVLAVMEWGQHVPLVGPFYAMSLKVTKFIDWILDIFSLLGIEVPEPDFWDAHSCFSPPGGPPTTHIVAYTAIWSPRLIDDFNGNWVDVDPNGRAVARLEIRDDGTTVYVHGYGHCSGAFCDWGEETMLLTELENLGHLQVAWTAPGATPLRLDVYAEPDGRLRAVAQSVNVSVTYLERES